jgi:hypothetical protein
MPSSYLAPGLAGRSCPEKGGRAVFAERGFRRGEVLAVFGGEVSTLAGLLEAPPGRRRLALQVDDDAFLVSTEEGPADWINHSCEPNAGMRGQVTLVAMRDIRPGEEVCFDYAMTDATAYDEFACRCGSASCRGAVRADDWRRPELAERYRSFFSLYLARRLRALAPRRSRRSAQAFG